MELGVKILKPGTPAAPSEECLLGTKDNMESLGDLTEAAWTV